MRAALSAPDVRGGDGALRDGPARPALRIAALRPGFCRGGLGLRPFETALAQRAAPSAVFASRKERLSHANSSTALAEEAKQPRRSRSALDQKRRGEISSPAKKHLDPAALGKLLAAAGVEDGDLLLVVAGRDMRPRPRSARFACASDAISALIDESQYRFCWVTDFPLLEYDERPDAGSRPTTLHLAPRGRPSSARSPIPAPFARRAYDVVLNGTELGGGSIRIHRADVQQRVFQALGIAEDGGARQVRVSARRTALRGPAARGDRARRRPYLHARRRRFLDPGRDRVSEDDVRARPDVEGAFGGYGRAAPRARALPPSPADGFHGVIPERSGGSRPVPPTSGSGPGLLDGRRPGSRGRRLRFRSIPSRQRRGALAPPRTASGAALRHGRSCSTSRSTTARRQEARRRRSASRTPRSKQACAATTPSSPSAAEWSPMSRALRPRSCCGESRGARFRRRPDAMADAAIGGKTGVDHALGKNLLGAFHPPDAVLVGSGRARGPSGARLSGGARGGRSRPPGSRTRISSARATTARGILARQMEPASGPARGRRRREGGDRRRRTLGRATAAGSELRPYPRPRLRGGPRVIGDSGTAKRWRGGSPPRSSSRGTVPGSRESDAVSDRRRALPASVPFPRPVHGRRASGAVSRAGQEGDRRRARGESSSKGSDRRASTRVDPGRRLDRGRAPDADRSADAREEDVRISISGLGVSRRASPSPGRIMGAPCPSLPRRRIRLFVVLCGALVLASVVPLLVSDGVLIRRNQRALETLEEKYLTRSSSAVADHVAAFYVAARGAAERCRRHLFVSPGACPGGIPSSPPSGRGFSRPRSAGQTQLARSAGGQFRGIGKLRRAGRPFAAGRLRVSQGIRGRPRRRPLSGTALSGRDARSRRGHRGAGLRRRRRRNRRRRGPRVLGADRPGVPRRGEAGGPGHPPRPPGGGAFSRRRRGAPTAAGSRSSAISSAFRRV